MTILKRAPMSNRAILDWLGGLGSQVAHGPDIAPDTPSAERDDNGQMVLECRPQDALLSRLVSEERRPTSNANGGGSN